MAKGVVNVTYRLERPCYMNKNSQDDKSHNIMLKVIKFIIISMVCSLISSCMMLATFMIVMVSDEKIRINLSVWLRSGQTNGCTKVILSFINRNTNVIYLISLFGAATMILMIVLYCKYVDKRSLVSIGLDKHGLIKEYAIGMVAGLVAICMVVGICSYTGCIKVSINPACSLSTIALFFAGFMLQGMSEEIFYRGYLITCVAEGGHIVTAVMTSSVLFAMLHVLNPNMTILAFINAFLFGIFAALYMIKRGSIWGIAAYHSMWNFAQGNIFGIPVSGQSRLESIFDTSCLENTLLNGGEFGVEGGIIVAIITIISIAILLRMKTRTVPEENSVSIAG